VISKRREGMKKQSYMKLLISVSILAFFLIGAFALAQAQAKKETPTKQATPAKGPIRIGVIDSYSGMAAVLTDDELKACRLYVDNINAKGGLLGRKIELIVRDDELKPDMGVKHLIDLYLEKKVDFCLGTASSSVLLANSEWCKRNKKFYLAWSTRSEKATGALGHRYIFRNPSDTDMDANAMAQFWAKEKYSKFYTISADYEYGHTVIEGFVKHMKRLKPDVQFLGEQWPKLNEIDYTAYIAPILQANPEVLYVGLWGGDAMTFIKQAKPYGLFQKMKALCLHGGLSLLAPIGLAMPEGVYVGTNYFFNFVDTPENTTFVQAYKEKYGIVPSDYAYIGYTGIKTLVEGIKKAKSVDQEKVIDALEGITIDTPGGPLTIRKYDHQGEMGIYVGITKKSPEFSSFLALEKLDYIPGSKIIRPLEEVKALREKR
jgi:branched-chain amino acid transport system substrate-binding protein